MADFAKDNYSCYFKPVVALTVLFCSCYYNGINTAAFGQSKQSTEMTFAIGQQALNSRQIEKCKESIALLKSTSAGAMSGLILEVRLLSQQGKFKEAISKLTQALKTHPNSSTLLAQRAQVYGYLDDEKQSCADYYAAAKCSNMTAEDCCTIVAGLIDYDKWEEAFAIAQIGLKLKPPSSNLCSSAADVARRLNKLDLAVEYIEKAITILPTKSSHYQELASIHKVMKKWPAVISDCTRLKASVKTAEGHLTYARCLEMSGEAHIELKQYEEAISDLTAARKISPLKTTILKTRAIAYTKLGKTALAKKDLADAKLIDNSF